MSRRGLARAVVCALVALTPLAVSADPPPDASREETPVSQASSLVGGDGRLTTTYIVEGANGDAAAVDHDLEYHLSLIMDPIVSTWVSVAFDGRLRHDLDGAVDEPRGLDDIVTDDSVEAPERVRGVVYELGLRLGPNDHHITIGRTASELSLAPTTWPSHVGPGSRHEPSSPTVDGARAQSTWTLAKWSLNLHGGGGLWADEWELGGCLAGGCLAGLGEVDLSWWGDAGDGDLTVAMAHFREIVWRAGARQTISLPEGNRLILAAGLGTFGDDVVVVDGSIETELASSQWLPQRIGASAEFTDQRRLPSALLGYGAVTAATAAGLRHERAPRRGRAGVALTWMDATEVEVGFSGQWLPRSEPRLGGWAGEDQVRGSLALAARDGGLWGELRAELAGRWSAGSSFAGSLEGGLGVGDWVRGELRFALGESNWGESGTEAWRRGRHGIGGALSWAVQAWPGAALDLAVSGGVAGPGRGPWAEFPLVAVGALSLTLSAAAE